MDTTMVDGRACEDPRDERKLLAIHLAETFCALLGPPLLMVLVVLYALHRGYETSPDHPRAARSPSQDSIGAP